jgi:hypothetical protein
VFQSAIGAAQTQLTKNEREIMSHTDLQIQNGPVEFFDPCKSVLSVSSVVRFWVFALFFQTRKPALRRAG